MKRKSRPKSRSSRITRPVGHKLTPPSKSGDGETWPQWVCKDISDSDHQLYLQDPVTFINKNKWFGALVATAAHHGFRYLPPTKKNSIGSGSPNWRVVAFKYPDCSVGAMSAQIQTT